MKVSENNGRELLKEDPIPFLLEGEPWTRLNTLTGLLGKPDNDPEVGAAREELRDHPLVGDLFNRLNIWFDTSVTRHNDPKLPPHILKALADLGVRAEDPGMPEILSQVEARREGPLFSVRQTLPDKGNNKPDPRADEWYALPCDSPEITSALLQLGHDSPAVRESGSEIIRLWKQEEDWFCHFFFVENQYKKHRIGCPMAGLMALDLFSRLPEKPDAMIIRKAFEPLVYHRDLGKSLYYFGRSKKFWTFKFPFVWYSALYLADVLTRFPEFHETPLVEELIEWVREGQNEDGLWKADSVFQVYKGFDFAQKREASDWITFLCCRILRQRYGGS